MGYPVEVEQSRDISVHSLNYSTVELQERIPSSNTGQEEK